MNEKGGVRGLIWEVWIPWWLEKWGSLPETIFSLSLCFLSQMLLLKSLCTDRQKAERWPSGSLRNHFSFSIVKRRHFFWEENSGGWKRGIEGSTYYCTMLKFTEPRPWKFFGPWRYSDLRSQTNEALRYLEEHLVPGIRFSFYPSKVV